MTPQFAHRLAAATILVAVAGALLQPLLDEQTSMLDDLQALTGATWLGQVPR
jgi:capsular polysaccharide biosynthesis protein